MRSFIRLIGREARVLGGNGMLLFNAGCILVLVCLIGTIYRQGVLSQIPLVIADLDQTSVSREIGRQLAASEKFAVTWAEGYGAVRQAMADGSARAGIVIPPGLAGELKKGRSAQMLLVIDCTNYIVGNTAYAKASEILQTVNGGLTLARLAGQGVPPATGAKTVQSVRLEQKVLYNPDYNYAYYLAYGVCGTGVFSLLMSGIALSLARQRQKSAFPMAELAAKFFVYGVFAALVTNLAFLAVRWLFDLPGRGSALNFILLTLPYGGLIALFGFLFCSLARGDELRVFQAAVFFATPLIFLTGYTWPRQSIPIFLMPLYFLNPLTPFLNGARASLVMGGPFPVVFKYIVWELALTCFYLIICLLAYHRAAPPAEGGMHRLS